MVTVTVLALAACVPSLLVGSQMQSKLMWAFITPLVGFNPNEINFFEAPIIKDRMTALLGDKYEPAMKLLHTANEIQREGALFYVVSRYAPPEAQAIVDTAGMVWNADTNQLAVLLIEDGNPELLAEQAASEAKAALVQALVPALPAPLQGVYDQALAAKAAVDAQQQALENLGQRLENPEDEIEQLLRQRSAGALPASP